MLISGGSNASTQVVIPTLDDSTIAIIAEMGFSKGKGRRSPKQIRAMEWLITHAEEPL